MSSNQSPKDDNQDDPIRPAFGQTESAYSTHFSHNIDTKELTSEKLPIWNFFRPPISVAQKRNDFGWGGGGERRNQDAELDYRKPHIFEQVQYLTEKRWTNYGKQKMSDFRDYGTINLFENIFSPTMFLHDSNELNKDIFDSFSKLSYLEKDEVESLHKNCVSVRKQMLENKKRALEMLEKTIDGQIALFDEKIFKQVTSKNSIFSCVDPDKFEKKVMSSDVILRNSIDGKSPPLTNLIFRCFDALVLVFEFMDTKDLLQNVSTSCSFFYKFIIKKVPICVSFSIMNFEIIKYENILSKYKIRKISYGAPSESYGPNRSMKTLSYERFQKLIKNHSMEIKCFRIFALQDKHIEDPGYEPIRSNNGWYDHDIHGPKRYSNLISQYEHSIKITQEIYDLVNTCPKLEDLVLSRLPSNMSNLSNLVHLEFDLGLDELCNPASKSILKKGLNDISTLTDFFLDQKRKKLKSIYFLDEGKYQMYKAEVAMPLFILTRLERLFDSVSDGCTNLQSFYSVLMYGFQCFSIKFLEYLAKVPFFCLVYIGKFEERLDGDKREVFYRGEVFRYERETYQRKKLSENQDQDRSQVRISHSNEKKPSNDEDDEFLNVNVFVDVSEDEILRKLEVFGSAMKKRSESPRFRRPALKYRDMKLEGPCIHSTAFRQHSYLGMVRHAGEDESVKIQNEVFDQVICSFFNSILTMLPRATFHHYVHESNILTSETGKFVPKADLVRKRRKKKQKNQAQEVEGEEFNFDPHQTEADGLDPELLLINGHQLRTTLLFDLEKFATKNILTTELKFTISLPNIVDFYDHPVLKRRVRKYFRSLCSSSTALSFLTLKLTYPHSDFPKDFKVEKCLCLPKLLLEPTDDNVFFKSHKEGKNSIQDLILDIYINHEKGSSFDPLVIPSTQNHENLVKKKKKKKKGKEFDWKFLVEDFIRNYVVPFIQKIGEVNFLDQNERCLSEVDLRFFLEDLSFILKLRERKMKDEDIFKVIEDREIEVKNFFEFVVNEVIRKELNPFLKNKEHGWKKVIIRLDRRKERMMKKRDDEEEYVKSKFCWEM